MLSHAAVFCSGGPTRGDAAGRPKLVVSVAKDPAQNQWEQGKIVWPEQMQILWSTLNDARGRDKDANEAARQSGPAARAEPVGRSPLAHQPSAAAGLPTGPAARRLPQTSRDPRKPPLGNGSTAFPGFLPASPCLYVCLEAATAAPTSMVCCSSSGC